MKEKYLILPLTKNPNPIGRIGPKEKQDWFRGLLKARDLIANLPGSKILIISNVFFPNGDNEADVYINNLKELGVTEEKIIIVRNNFETIGQIETAKKIMNEKKEKMIVISTWLHYLRVRYLFSNCHPIKHYIAFGIPRPREILTDITLTFLLPILDFFKLRTWLRKKIEQRRTKGKF